ncbi:hypothetical protein TI39_contig537g00004 [Zymoseptoria brevis]|uniref:Small secreted protein n=1 Tax=Zymoseptoria brevis TaxID=1047168 RepID=A0A0F4GJC5_9PEZI|nr:hypothetical protein TI39_contig537g00004 [Zymoseptoria brevis]
MHISPTTSLSIALLLAALTTATLDPATSNTKGKKPSKLGCSATKVSKRIQAAECAYNTRVSGQQTFSVFVTDSSISNPNGAPYGTCSAYTCTAPTTSQMESDSSAWTFFWKAGGGQGEKGGVGTKCIQHPNTGECGCERSSDGVFFPGKGDCV